MSCIVIRSSKPPPHYIEVLQKQTMVGSTAVKTGLRTSFKISLLATIIIVLFGCAALEIFVFKAYSPHIHGILKQNLPWTSGAVDGSYADALISSNMESPDLDDLQSPLIITPRVYNSTSVDDDVYYRAPGVRKTKIISFYKVKEHNNWFIKNRDYNRDFKRCAYSECAVDTEGKHVATADVVLFICKGLKPPPGPRPTGQLWALGCWESDRYWDYPNYATWKDAFNITFSYRMDSDVFSIYRKLAWKKPQFRMEKKDLLAMAREKKKTATWWASNCRGDRSNYVKEMQKYIDIDIYGSCGKKKCPRKNENSCLDKLNTTYKFYLSFENTFCKSYVTEKIVKLFHSESYSHIIPVVKGGLDYEKHFPNMAFVNGNKFKSAKELALYLKQLGSDEETYVKMLQEKDKLVSPPHLYPDWCEVCEMLHTKKFGVYRDIRKNWSHNTCKNSEYL